MRDRVVAYLEKRVAELSSKAEVAARDLEFDLVSTGGSSGHLSSFGAYFQGELDKIKSELALAVALLAVAKRHKPIRVEGGSSLLKVKGRVCAECRVSYPCPTRLDVERSVLS